MIGFGIIGGDRRQLYLARSLAEDGHLVLVNGMERAQDTAGLKMAQLPDLAERCEVILLPLPVTREGAALNANDTPSTAVFYGAEGTMSESCYKVMWDRYTNAFVSEMQAFAEAVSKDLETPVTGMDGLYPVLMAAAAVKSLKEHRPVAISEVE